MPIEEFIINVYCMVDKIVNEKIAPQTLRFRGFEPKLTDSEVITMEIVGAFLGIDIDKNIWSYFCSHVISGMTVSSANIDERCSVWDMTNQIQGLFIGDMDIDNELKKDLEVTAKINLQTPKRSNMQHNRDPKFVKAIKSCRRLIETVIGQLVWRFNMQKVWARDLWHLTSRVARKILAHTLAIFINREIGREYVQFDGLITC